MSVFEIKRAWGVGDADWFRVVWSHDHHNGDRVWIDRVVAFALGATKDTVDHLTVITSDGLPCTATEDQWMFADTMIVKGCDQSPTGESWSKVFADATPTIMQHRDITSPMLASEARSDLTSSMLAAMTERGSAKESL